MTRSPRVTGKELKKVLGKAGFQLARIEGSHHIMKRPFPPARVSVPVHSSKIIKPGVYKQILRIAGLTDDDVRRWLE